MRYTLRPLTAPGKTKPRQRSPFDSKWSDTLEVLAREVKFLQGRDVVIEVDVADHQLRLDGGLRANVTPASPAVAVAFTSAKLGPLIWRCDRYFAGQRGRVDGWQHNVRAIAKTLENLRAIDRYGAASSGEQYTGYRQIGSGPAIVADPPMDRGAAAEALVRFAYPGVSPTAMTADLLAGRVELAAVARRAQRTTHPDTGGEPGRPEAFALVQRAIAVLRGPS